jgi:hypothetical protein
MSATDRCLCRAEVKISVRRLSGRLADLAFTAPARVTIDHTVHADPALANLMNERRRNPA